jgi:hypothetical protein
VASYLGFYETSPLLSLFARLSSFILGSLLAVIILISFIDD